MKLPPFLLERFFARFEFSVPHMLAASDCETVSISDLFQGDPARLEAFLRLKLGYSESAGNPDLRGEIASLYERQTADSVIVCAGAQEAIFLVMNGLLSAGDHIIVHSPCYQSLTEVPKAIGCSVTRWMSDEENRWDLELDFLKKAITPKTRLLVVNLPHNPTGFQMPPAQFARLVEICRRHGTILVADEVYRFLEYEEKDRLPAAADCYENGISIGVMSKSFGLAGLRIGWVVASAPGILQKLAVLKDYTTICNSGPAEHLALLALQQKERLLSRNLSILRKNLKYLQDFFVASPGRLTWVEPRAGCVAFPRFLKTKINAGFYEGLAESEGLLLLPGTCFGYPAHYFRIGFGRSDFVKGWKKFSDYLGKNPFKEMQDA